MKVQETCKKIRSIAWTAMVVGAGSVVVVLTGIIAAGLVYRFVEGL